MAEGTCSEPGCDAPVVSRGWCKRCYSRWYAKQTYVRRPRRVKGVCSIEGCEKPHYGRGWCVMHLTRWRRHGDPLISMFSPGERTRIGPNGYVYLTAPTTHPLWRKPGQVERQHRLVLFDAIGYGPHLCHWCGCHINWYAGLEVDHVDEVKANNDRANLVESCHRCNSARSHRLHPERYGKQPAA